MTIIDIINNTWLYIGLLVWLAIVSFGLGLVIGFVCVSL